MSGSAAFGLLGEVGIHVSGGMDELDLVLPDGSRVAATARLGNSPNPAQIAADRRTAGGRRVLYCLHSAGAAVVGAAQRGEVDLVTFDERRVVIGAKDFLDPPSTCTTEPRRRPWGRWAIERVRLLDPKTVRQADIAAAVGTSQQAVAKSLKVMSSKPVTVHEWLSTYPGAGGLKQWWYHLEGIAPQGDIATRALAELGLSGRMSGDSAADRYAPWRLPVQAHVYTPELVDLTPWGFVSASQAEATLVMQVPEDRTLWATADWYQPQGGLVDPLIALWDVAHALGSDALDAAEKLAEAIMRYTDGA